jgi:hypothetical protein
MRLGDWWFLLGLIVLAAMVRVSVMLAGFSRTVSGLPRIPLTQDGAPVEEAEMRRHRRAISAASRLSPVLNCLSVSIAAWWLLRRRGIVTHMRFGMTKADTKLLAHAWIEHRGRPVTNERGLDRYVVFDSSML